MRTLAIGSCMAARRGGLGGGQSAGAALRAILRSFRAPPGLQLRVKIIGVCGWLGRLVLKHSSWYLDSVGIRDLSIVLLLSVLQNIAHYFEIFLIFILRAVRFSVHFFFFHCPRHTICTHRKLPRRL